jgi:hypothetical protein
MSTASSIAMVASSVRAALPTIPRIARTISRFSISDLEIIDLIRFAMERLTLMSSGSAPATRVPSVPWHIISEFLGSGNRGNYILIPLKCASIEGIAFRGTICCFIPAAFTAAVQARIVIAEKCILIADLSKDSMTNFCLNKGIGIL